MDRDLKVLEELQKRGILFLRDRLPIPTLLKLKDGTKFSFLHFQNSEIVHEESQNHFAVYYTKIEELKEEIQYFREAKPETLLKIIQLFPYVLSFGTLLAIDTENPKKEFLAVSNNSIDNISQVHNLVNYLILIEIIV
jgi:hypothetical protein